MTISPHSRRFTILLTALLLIILLASRVSAAVELIDFTIEAQEDQVRLEWKTGSELDNAGFRVLRKADSDGEGDPIEVYFPDAEKTTEFIPAMGDSVTGAEYVVFDENIEPGTTYFYKLEDVANSNQTTIHDPEPLSVTIPSEATPTHTPTNTPTATPTPTNTPTRTPTHTATRTNTPQPTRTNTPAPSTTPTLTTTPQPATATPTSTQIARVTRAATATWTPRPTATEGDSGAAEAQEVTPSPSVTPTSPPEAEQATAYPPPVQTVPATAEALPQSPTPAPAPALVDPEQPNVDVPLTIVQPPSGFDVLAFFGRVLAILIGMLTVAFIGAAVWFVRIA